MEHPLKIGQGSSKWGARLSLISAVLAGAILFGGGTSARDALLHPRSLHAQYFLAQTTPPPPTPTTTSPTTPGTSICGTPTREGCDLTVQDISGLSDGVLTITTTIANIGNHAAQQVMVAAHSSVLGATYRSVPVLTAGETMQAVFKFPIPDSARGTFVTVAVTIDPGGLIGEWREDNNTLSREFPIPTVTPPTTTSTSSKTQGGSTSTGNGGGSTWPAIVLAVASALLLGILGLSLALRLRTSRRLVSLQLEAHDEEPPDHCAPGQLYCKRDFDLESAFPRNRIHDLSLDAWESSKPQPVTHRQLEGQPVDDLRAAIEAIRSGDRLAARSLLAEVGQRVLWEGRRSVGGEEKFGLMLCAHTEGDELACSFKLYRCAATSTYQEVPPEWHATIKHVPGVLLARGRDLASTPEAVAARSVQLLVDDMESFLSDHRLR